jgi:hypothetical protein
VYQEVVLALGEEWAGVGVVPDRQEEPQDKPSQREQ